MANQIQSIHGILNGTSNFILTQMEDCGKSYADALAEAQKLGFAEANPAMDVNGSDAAQKLAILAHLSFGARVDWKLIPRTGIDTVDVADMRYARELGYSIKLLAVAELVPEGLELHVSPTLVRQRSTLAQVQGAFNAIRIVGDAVGRVFLHGLGAGQMPTASACVADLIDTLLGRTAITFRTLQALVRRSRGAGGPPRSGQRFRPFLRPLPRRRSPRRDGRNRRHPRPPQDLDRLGDPARNGGRIGRNRAPGDHDPYHHRRRHPRGPASHHVPSSVRPGSVRLRVRE